MNYESWISYRYLMAKKDRFLSMINFVAVAGIAIGVMALIVVIGVMTGFDRDLRDKIIGTNAHVMVERETGVKNYPEVLAKLGKVKDIKALSPYIHGNVFLESNQRAMSLVLRGVDPAHEPKITKIDEYLASGKIETLTPDQVVVGSQLASYYGFRVGDEITVIAPASGVAGEGWRYQLKIAGIFTSGMYDYDMNLILVHLSKAQQIFSLGDGVVSGIGVKINDVYAAPAVKEKIYEVLGYSYLVRTWIENNSNFFAALRLEKFAMFVILTLIVLVASFNIISTLIVTVTSKVKDIGILKSIGVPKSSIRKIFTLQGICLGIMGTFWGVVGGALLTFLLKKYQFIKLPQDIYYIDHLPVLLQLSDVLAIVGAALLISYLATIYPAGKAASLEPVEALRYE
ncbi:MAG: ABC transporter permease [Candidatus Omnitrophica bacterium]|nr:ABC transporter permease [Candidatus Omnitrophota bacterium]